MKPGLLVRSDVPLIEKVSAIIELYNDGVFGTPFDRNRGGSGKNTFWIVYDGLRPASYFKGGINYPYAVAAEQVRNGEK